MAATAPLPAPTIPDQPHTAPIRLAPREPPTTVAAPAPLSPAPPLAATSTTFRSHLANEPMEGFPSHLLGYPTTPSAATPTNRAVEPKVATIVLDVKIHTKPVPHASRNLQP